MLRQLPRHRGCKAALYLSEHRQQLRSQGPARPGLCPCKDAIGAVKFRLSAALQQCLTSQQLPFVPCCRIQTHRGTGRADGSQLPRASGSHLDRLVRSAVEIVLRSHQRSHPVIETCQLLLQLELGTYDIPDLRKAQTHTEESRWDWAVMGQNR